MSELYNPRRIDEFTTLSVYRRVDSGADQFIDISRSLVDTIVGSEVTAQFPIDGQDEYLPAKYPYYDISRAGDLALSLYARRDAPETRPESRFNSVKKKLTDGVPVPNKNESLRRPGEGRESLTDSLDRIQFIDYNIDEDDVVVEIVAMGVRFAADVKNGLYELTLIPDVSSKVGEMLLKQARFIQGRVALESSKVASGPSADSLEIPFASVRSIPSSLTAKNTRLHRELRAQLGFAVQLGKPKID